MINKEKLYEKELEKYNIGENKVSVSIGDIYGWHTKSDATIDEISINEGEVSCSDILKYVIRLSRNDSRDYLWAKAGYKKDFLNCLEKMGFEFHDENKKGVILVFRINHGKD